MKKEDILANCIDEILAGKCTLADCLARYPHISDELRPLLQVALSIQSEDVTPSPEFKQRARNRLLEAMQSPIAPVEHRMVDIFGWLKPAALARRAVVAIIIATVLVGGSGIAYAAQGSMPDSVLYPVKIATEKARLALTPSSADKAGIYIAFAERRVQEMVEMGRKGKAEEMTKLITALDYHLEQAQVLIEFISIEGGDTHNIRIILEQSATRQLSVLEDTLDEVSEQMKPSFDQALMASGKEYGAAIEVAASVAPAPLLVAKVGTIQIRATDPPPPDADSVLVKVGKIEVHRAGGSDSGWITIVDGPVTFDLLKVAEVQKFLGSQEVPVGTYTQLRFIVIEATVIIGEEEYIASVPSGELKLVRPFQVTEGETTLVLLDFDGNRSLLITGRGEFKLKPIVKLLVPSPTKEAVDEEEEDGEPEPEIEATKVKIEGTVVSFDGDELVLAVAGQEVIIPLGAGVEIEGDIEIGSWAEVEAVAEDGSFLAMEIEVEEVGKDKNNDNDIDENDVAEDTDEDVDDEVDEDTDEGDDGGDGGDDEGDDED